MVSREKGSLLIATARQLRNRLFSRGRRGYFVSLKAFAKSNTGQALFPSEKKKKKGKGRNPGAAGSEFPKKEKKKKEASRECNEHEWAEKGERKKKKNGKILPPLLRGEKKVGCAAPWPNSRLREVKKKKKREMSTSLTKAGRPGKECLRQKERGGGPPSLSTVNEIGGDPSSPQREPSKVDVLGREKKRDTGYYLPPNPEGEKKTGSNHP